MLVWLTVPPGSGTKQQLQRQQQQDQQQLQLTFCGVSDRVGSETKQ